MRPFYIGDEQEVHLNKLREFAENHRIDIDEVLDIYNKQAPPVDDREGYVCVIPFGFRVVFCIVHQKQGWARHLSISLLPAYPHKSPHPKAVQMVMDHLGFVNKLETGDNELVVYFENNTIVNVIEYIK